MGAIFSVTIPFFALVLCGYVAARAHWLPAEAIPGLNTFVLYFALPCLLLRFGASLPVAQTLSPVLAGIYLVASLLLVSLVVFIARRHRQSREDAAFSALTAVFPNTGFMGVPLLAALFGPAAAGPVIASLLVDLLVTSSLCIGLAESSKFGHGGVRKAVSRSVRGMLANPLAWAILAGIVAKALQVNVTGPVDTVIRMLGDAATPVALFTIGAVLWRAGAQAGGRSAPLEVLALALVKLVVHPLVVIAAGLAAQALGLPVSRFNLAMLALAAALPSASTVSLLAQRYGADNGRVARAIVASTAAAFVTFSVLAAFTTDWLK